MGSRAETTTKRIEDRLDYLFEIKKIIPVLEKPKLYVGVMGLSDFEASMRIMKKFTFLNIFPVDEWDTHLWSEF